MDCPGGQRNSLGQVGHFIVLSACSIGEVRMNQNCLSHWFPLIRDAGLPVPETRIVRLPDGAAEALFQVFDGKECGSAAQPFLTELRGAAEDILLPCFLRTGQTSGKHNWENTCELLTAGDLYRQVLALIEFSECAGFVGLPWDVWVVRRMLPTKPVITLPMYGNMPLCREFRCFVRDGLMECWHPYWPATAVREGFERISESELLARLKLSGEDPEKDEFGYIKNWPRRTPENFLYLLQKVQEYTPDEEDLIRDLAQRAGEAVGGGYWSVDILETERGWYVTDMALGEVSYHWRTCEKNPPKS